jgi:hypothetical protein
VSVFVGAYPLLLGRGHDSAELYSALSGSPDIRGLELPWTVGLTLDDLLDLRSLVPRTWQFVLTMIPGTMGRMGADPHYGLASDDPDGARAAVEDVIDVCAVVRDFHNAVGTEVVTHVELHSAPRAPALSSRGSLARSLALVGAACSGPEFVLEHVDAPVPGRDPAKGFLQLADEINAVSDAGMGLVVNWGRSAIEARSVVGPTVHIAEARRAGVLRGLVLSGVSDADSPLGPAWSDEHLPFTDVVSESLLTVERAVEAIALAGDVFLGVKMNMSGRPPIAVAAEMVVDAAARVASMRRVPTGL